jgi:putative ABC transport system permease protein
LSYTTAQRTREIGVRTALGAARRDILKLVLRQGMMITITGLVAGLAAAFFLAQSLSKLLYGVSARDPVSFMVVPVILVAVALTACAVPAWRAVRVDPLRALRFE